MGVFTLSTRYLLYNRLCNSLGEAGAKKNNKENVKKVFTTTVYMYIQVLIFYSMLYARTTCMYLCNEECNVNYVLRVCTYATKNVK